MQMPSSHGFYATLTETSPVIQLDFRLPYPSSRAPVMGRNVVSTSQPLAAQAGLRMLLRGGNAIDAAIAAAMTLTVVEPTGCGLGSDAFAIVWDGANLHALNSSGRSPAALSPDRFRGQKVMTERGWDSVTVPGAVAAWVELARRFGTLPLSVLAEPAIGYARNGFIVSPKIAALWQIAAGVLGKQPGFADAFLPGGRAPKAGEVFKSEAQARSLELIAETNGKAFYEGVLAEGIAAFAKRHGGALTANDLAAHTADWVDPIAGPFEGYLLQELPPNGQGIATLMALGMIEALGPIGDSPDDPETLHVSIEAMKLAFADLLQYVSDPASMRVSPQDLLDPAYLASRAKLIDRNHASEPVFGAPKRGGTVYLAAADDSGRMISFIQSNYMGFGSGVVAPGGISLQNRGAGFVLEPGHANEVGPRKRPLHTIIPGFVTDAAGAPVMAFGVMGGFMQAQGHLQMALRMLRYRQNPQAAADAPRWRVLTGRSVALEPAIGAATIEALRARGHDVVVDRPDNDFAFGGAQLVLRTEGGYIAGSDPRKDGQAVAF
jgi:gamma-glutamyltranspeptidase / glutathione hydrolase